MIRKIVKIDETKCNGCGICVNACHEGAIVLVNGKAKLISDEYCDGLGACLPGCPEGAIEITEREAEGFDEAAVQTLMDEKAKKNEDQQKEPLACGCPGTAAKRIERRPAPVIKSVEVRSENTISSASELRQWPVQLNLINTRAEYLKGANLLIAADCTAYAYADFHKDFIKDHITVIGCPKLDDVSYYKEKLTEMIKNSNFKSITVVRMEVPCCGGIVSAVKGAMLQAQIIVPYKEVTIGTDGSIR